MPSLAEFQRDLAAALRAPLIAPAAEPAGLRIHRNTVMKGLVDAILANYPTLEVLMGREWMTGAAQAFARQHPPAHAVLADYGEGFAGFLAAADEEAQWPWLQGVAQLDRAWTCALLAANVPALTPHSLRLSAADLAACRPSLHPSVTLGCYAGSAVSVWQSNRPPARPPESLEVNGTDETAVMVRNQDGITLLRLDAAGYTFLQTVMQGGTLQDAAMAALQAQPEVDLASLWATLLTQGLFVNPMENDDVDH